MTDLKACPFCDKEPLKMSIGDERIAKCSNLNCQMNTIWFTIDEWNSRPIEDRLRRELVGLAEAIRVHLSPSTYTTPGAKQTFREAIIKKATAIIDEHGSKGGRE
jgi:hypothetical protein